jgi:hypothetical protein
MAFAQLSAFLHLSGSLPRRQGEYVTRVKLSQFCRKSWGFEASISAVQNKGSPDYLEGRSGLQVLVRNGRWPAQVRPHSDYARPASRASGASIRQAPQKSPADGAPGQGTMLATRRMSLRRGFSLRGSAKPARAGQHNCEFGRPGALDDQVL